ncbi:HNH endonuclease family protein, partial [Citricoccus sp.]|uniref:HNH endonuclease family protein n=1 Tax=Citricoccus sp. TaxID=1978372 RepID=UPI002CAD8C49
MNLQRLLSAGSAALALVLVTTGCVPGADSPSSTPTASTTATTAAASVAATPTTPSAQAASTAATTPAPHPRATADRSLATGTPSPTIAPQRQGSGPAAAGTALAVLEALPVKGRAPKTGYGRDQFGPAWADVDRNGCDTRNDMLARDLAGERFKPGTHDCVVLSGVLDDPYTATEIHFLRGQDTSNDVQIDHVVALSDAWQKGARQLSADERIRFANDPVNLLAVDGPANAQKSDSDAASWLPPNRSFRCDYVARQIAVKAEYGLWVTSAEKDAMTRVLDGCPDQALPTAQTAATAYSVITRSTQSPAPAPSAQAPSRTRAPELTPRKAQTPAPRRTYTPAPPTTAAAVYFKNCTAARAAGAAPVR